MTIEEIVEQAIKNFEDTYSPSATEGNVKWIALEAARLAVASERERCARIAIDHFKGDPYYSEMGLAVARAIEQEPKP